MLGHDGGIDGNGGHNDRKAGNYHFHRGPLAGRTYSSKTAALAALKRYRAGPTKSPTAAKSPATIIKRASTSKKIDALIALLVKKGLVKEAELAAPIQGR